MAEVLNEATYVKHHKKKIAYIFSAMRHFAEDLIQSGFKVEYVKLDNSNNTGSFFGEVSRAFKFFKPDRIVVTEPSEYRVLKDMKSWENQLSVPIEFRPDDRFLYSPSEFAKWAKGRKQLRMEYFYREVRKKFGILMDGKNPEGGLNKKGVASYRKANPGSKLKTAVTTKPSKLKKGSKAANRRKSFCARMSGMKKKLTSSKTANDPKSRINKSLRKWNC